MDTTTGPANNLQDEVAALTARNKPLGWGLDIDAFANDAHKLFNRALEAHGNDPAVVNDAAALVHDADRYLRLRAEVRGWRRDW